MRKVGVFLSKKEILKTIIENNGGIAKTSDFAVNGINKYEVAAFCKEGVIERIRRGFYQLPKSKTITEEQLIRELLPQGIICVESALFHYGWYRVVLLSGSRTRAKRLAEDLRDYDLSSFYSEDMQREVRCV